MNKVKIDYYNKNIIGVKAKEKVVLPKEVKQKINDYWNSLIQNKPWFTRGIIYEASGIQEENEKVIITLNETDYSHYMYGNNVDSNYKCKNCWAGFLLETLDHYYVLGQTNTQTELPGELHLIGGLIDNNDILHHEVDIYSVAVRELEEEIGIDATNTKLVNNLSTTYIISE